MAQEVQNLPAKAGEAGDLGSTLGQEDPENERANPLQSLAWAVP